MSQNELESRLYEEANCDTNYNVPRVSSSTRLLDNARIRWNLSRRKANVIPDESLEDLSRDEELNAELAMFRSSAAFNRIYNARYPLVSVCITTADRPEVLRRRALWSLMRQTYRNMQIIVVGDHCDERTAKVIREVNDPRISYFNLPQRGPYPPPGYARWMVAGTHPANEALRQIKGDFVTHLDEDDTFSEGRICDLVQALQQSRADVVHHPFWWERDDKSWVILGNGVFQLGQTGTSMVMYHRWLAQIPWNVKAYQVNEPGDWNRFKKFVRVGAQIVYVDKPLTWHWHFPLRGPFVPHKDEEYMPQ